LIFVRNLSCFVKFHGLDLFQMNLLHQCRYTIVSTGGTATSLEDAGVLVTRVEEITHFPEMV